MAYRCASMKNPRLKITSDGKATQLKGPLLVVNSQHPVFAKQLPNPTPDMLNGDPIFDTIWEVIKNWDVNVPDYYWGYCGATGSHATLIYQALMKVLPKP